MLSIYPEPIDVELDLRRKHVPVQKIAIAADSIDRSDHPQFIQKRYRADIPAMKDHIRLQIAKRAYDVIRQMGFPIVNMRI